MGERSAWCVCDESFLSDRDLPVVARIPVSSFVLTAMLNLEYQSYPLLQAKNNWPGLWVGSGFMFLVTLWDSMMSDVEERNLLFLILLAGVSTIPHYLYGSQSYAHKTTVAGFCPHSHTACITNEAAASLLLTQLQDQGEQIFSVFCSYFGFLAIASYALNSLKYSADQYAPDNGATCIDYYLYNIFYSTLVGGIILTSEIALQRTMQIGKNKILDQALISGFFDGNTESAYHLQSILVNMKQKVGASFLGTLANFSALVGLILMVKSEDPRVKEFSLWVTLIFKITLFLRVSRFFKKKCFYNVDNNALTDRLISDAKNYQIVGFMLTGLFPVFCVMTAIVLPMVTFSRGSGYPDFYFSLGVQILLHMMHGLYKGKYKATLSAEIIAKKKYAVLKNHMSAICDVSDKSNIAMRYAKIVLAYAINPVKIGISKLLSRRLAKAQLMTQDEAAIEDIRAYCYEYCNENDANSFVEEMTDLVRLGDVKQWQFSRDAMAFWPFLKLEYMKQWINNIGHDGIAFLKNFYSADYVSKACKACPELLLELRFDSYGQVDLACVQSIDTALSHKNRHIIFEALLEHRENEEHIKNLFSNGLIRCSRKNKFLQVLSEVLFFASSNGESKPHSRVIDTRSWVSRMRMLPENVKEALTRYWLKQSEVYCQDLKKMWMSSRDARGLFTSPRYRHFVAIMQPDSYSAKQRVIQHINGEGMPMAALQHSIGQLEDIEKFECLEACDVRNMRGIRPLLNSVSAAIKSGFLVKQYKKALSQIVASPQEALQCACNLAQIEPALLKKQVEGKTLFDHMLNDNACQFDLDIIKTLPLTYEIWCDLGLNNDHWQPKIERGQNALMKLFFILYEIIYPRVVESHPLRHLLRHQYVENANQVWADQCELKGLDWHDYKFESYIHGEHSVLLKISANASALKKIKKQLSCDVMMTSSECLYLSVDYHEQLKLKDLFKKNKKAKNQFSAKKKKKPNRALAGGQEQKSEAPTSRPKRHSPKEEDFSAWNGMIRGASEEDPSANRAREQVPTRPVVILHGEQRQKIDDTEAALLQFNLDKNMLSPTLSDKQKLMHRYIHRSGLVMFFIQWLEKLRKNDKLEVRVRAKLTSLRNNMVHYCNVNANTPLIKEQSKALFKTLRSIIRHHAYSDDVSAASIFLEKLPASCDSTRAKKTREDAIALRDASLKALRYVAKRLQKQGILRIRGHAFASFDKTVDMYALYYHAAMLVEAEKIIRSLNARGASMPFFAKKSKSSGLMRALTKVRNKLCHESQTQPEYVLLSKDNMNCLAELLYHVNLMSNESDEEHKAGAASAAAPSACGIR